MSSISINLENKNMRGPLPDKMSFCMHSHPPRLSQRNTSHTQSNNSGKQCYKCINQTRLFHFTPVPHIPSPPCNCVQRFSPIEPPARNKKMVMSLLISCNSSCPNKYFQEQKDHCTREVLSSGGFIVTSHNNHHS